MPPAAFARIRRNTWAFPGTYADSISWLSRSDRRLLRPNLLTLRCRLSKHFDDFRSIVSGSWPYMLQLCEFARTDECGT